ncbi:hypothetical protein EIN_409990 [Entamoeba invadens IP1]|uniref:Uncharacterized protein n=1 Tax=Entamoeba invadens IP1 TaxID=370355 RepID=A0A0A1TZR2_ENTIV|nr:hypothetical protein EIN_409990 [Entamoeba invadens IP1]ELP85680.1 hypothetical protein EIN_409990 [Entamoeba invadens IP1]|eukprot:XP_004185026.1 hypothetical protein EIN_409990 [Entamoeba invadens IP1]
MEHSDHRLKNIMREHEFKNDFCYEQAILIFLVNQFGAVTLEKPGKQSILTTTMPKVINLDLDGENIDLKRLSERQSSLLFGGKEKNGIKAKTLSRRFSKNKTIFIQNFLFDVLLEKGYFFNTKLSKKSNKTIQLERIKTVFLRGKLIFNKNEIIELGKKINDALSNLVDTKGKITLEKEEPILMEIFSSSVSASL